MTQRFVAVLITALIALPITGCLRDACAHTAATRASGAVLLDDASDKLAQAAALLSDRPDAQAALTYARASLDSARLALSGFEGVCEGVDVRGAFSDFVDAWHALAPFLALLGGHSGSRVADPIVVSQ